jgi:Transposase IS116/IS110/IS902 family
VGSYLGLIPAENSSGGRQRLGHISKQGNALLRGLLVEAAHVAARHEPELGRCYRRGDAQAALDRGRGRGSQAGGAVVVDVDSRAGVWATARIRFACRVSPV